MKERWWKSKWSTQLATGLGAAALKSHTVTSSLRCDHSVTIVWPRSQDTTPGWPWLLGSELEDYGKRSAALTCGGGDQRWWKADWLGWRLAACCGSLKYYSVHPRLWSSSAPRTLHFSADKAGDGIYHLCAIPKVEMGRDTCHEIHWNMSNVLMSIGNALFSTSVFVGISRTPSCLGLVSGCCLVIWAYLQNGPNNYSSPYLWGAATV